MEFFSLAEQEQIAVTAQAEMSRLTTFRIGGPCRWLMEPDTEEKLLRALALCRQTKTPHMLLGNGSNLLVSDEGIDGAVIRTCRLKSIIRNENLLTAQCGVPLNVLCRYAAENGLSGLEFAYGIPGTVGGAAVMNAGAYGGELAQVCTAVRAVDSCGTVHVYRGEELGFGYRRSAFADKTVLDIQVQLQPDEPGAIFARMEDYMNRRREKQPLEWPSAGSVFKRPEGYFAGALIEQAGLKGCCVGGACVSEKHAGFIVNKGGATCGDVRALIEQVRQTVHKQFGVALECEIRFCGK